MTILNCLSVTLLRLLLQPNKNLQKARGHILIKHKKKNINTNMNMNMNKKKVMHSLRPFQHIKLAILPTLAQQALLKSSLLKFCTPQTQQTLKLLKMAVPPHLTTL